MSEDKPNPWRSEEEPAGNIWGSKMTLWGGLFILFMLGVVLYRHYALDVPFGMDEERPVFEQPYYQKKAQEEAQKKDSTDTN